MAIETSSLDDTFYRHFFDPEQDVRDRAGQDLDQWFAEAGEAGASRYEVTRQMICAIINAQNQRDAEGAAEAKKSNNGVGSSYPPQGSMAATSTNRGGVPFKMLLLTVVIIFAATFYVFRLFTPA